MMVYNDYVQNRYIVMKVTVNLDRAQVVLTEKKKNNIKNLVKVGHWKVWLVHLIMVDRFLDDLMIDQIEMRVKDYHNNLIDYYYHYLFDLTKKMEEDVVKKVDNHHEGDDDNVLMDHFLMKQVEN